MTLAREELGIEVLERSIPRSEIYSADEVFFSGTAMEVTAVVEIDNRKIADGHQGDVCRKIKSLFFPITSGENEKYSHYLSPVYEK